ncbi:MAG: hypothetical protein AMJ46_11500 [Latescibacteria bacterium DG_63]|nr:MAG: hypothetical protein AMJ46_11500 [Latescibacteria bacterium DG_63]
MKGALAVGKCPPEEILLKFVENDLDESEANLLTEHTDTCDRCRGLLKEYKKTLVLLGPEKIEVPSSAEWERIMARVRARMEVRSREWPLWLKGILGGAAAACVLLLLWQADLKILRRPEGVSGLAERSGPSLPYGEGDSLLSDEDMFDEPLIISEMASLNLASMNYEELSELDELVSGAGTLESWDLLVFDLSEDEETELVKQLENSSPI